ncbi:MAG: hypothetical protein KDA41_18110, partial [Planctomycetales bacterium]|nr:hypothetical protein [Planctomycetales bacterium]
TMIPQRPERPTEAPGAAEKHGDFPLDVVQGVCETPRPYIPLAGGPFLGTEVFVMNRTLAIAIVVGLCWIGSAVPCARAEGWLPRPFQSKSSGTTSTKKSNKGLWNGAKRIAGDTRDRLTPWRDHSANEPNAFLEGTHRFFRPDLAHQQTDTRRWYRPRTWLDEPDTPPRQPLTVSDWIGQDRPGVEQR